MLMVTSGPNGWGEIRTREGCYTPHAFQACALSHSATHPLDDDPKLMRRSAVCIRPHLSPECCRALPETGSEDTYREGDARDGQDESEESIRGDPNMIVCVISRGTAGRDHNG